MAQGRPANPGARRVAFFTWPWLALIISLLQALVSSRLGLVAGARWGDFSSSSCVLPGYRKHYSRLWSISGDWDEACRATPATVVDTYFRTPDKCIDKGIGGEWGEFYLRDTGCDHYWGSFQDDGCKGDGRRQESSVLYGVPSGLSWEEWCDQAWAEVDGVYFERPSRCVNVGSGINMWGEFDVPDPCCGDAEADDSPTAPLEPGDNLLLARANSSSSSSSRARRRRSLLQTNGDTCVAAAGGSGGLPPNDPGKMPSTPADAIDVFGDPDEFDAWAASFFLILTSGVGSGNEDLWSVTVNSGLAGITNYTVYWEQGGGKGLRFVPGQSYVPPNARTASFPALAVPVFLAPGLNNYDDGTTQFSDTQWQSISLLDNSRATNPVRIVATTQLSGCCVATGWDPATRTFYMGHARPDSTASLPQLRNGLDLANHFRTQQQPFAGVVLDPQEVNYIGRPYGEYNSDRANIIGILGRTAVFLVVQFYNTGGNIVGHNFVHHTS